MPYISQDDRSFWAPVLQPLLNRINENTADGELNYLITRILVKTKPTRYTHFNKLIGVLESAKQEFYRRVVGPYENKKIEENGDVYE